MDEFLVKVLIWHTADQAYYEPGSVVRLDHLTQDEIDQLVRDGVVEPYVNVKTRKHIEKGDDE
jgi:hypothetical protein